MIHVPEDSCHHRRESECMSKSKIQTTKLSCRASTAQKVIIINIPTTVKFLKPTISGRISFTSHTPGEHVICMYSNSTAWFSGSQLRVHLDIQVGEHAIDYANVAQKEKLTELQLRIRQLLDQVEQITKEQNYQRYREERFRQTSESTNKRVLYWSVGQTAVLLVMGLWQMKHLKSFFEAKKLV